MVRDLRCALEPLGPHHTFRRPVDDEHRLFLEMATIASPSLPEPA